MLKNRIILYATLMILLLAGCSQETDITLSNDRKWRFETELNLNLGLMPELNVGIFEGLGMGVDTGAMLDATLELGFDQLTTYYKTQGLEASWHKPFRLSADEDTYRISIKGQGWDNLSRLTEFDPALFGQTQDVAANIPQVDISVIGLGGNKVKFIYDIPEDISGMGGLFMVTFRLHGSEIISCVGCSIKGGTATWVNPSDSIEAVLIPGSSMPQFTKIGLSVLGISFGVGVVILFVKLFSTRNQRPTYSRSRSNRSKKYNSRQSRNRRTRPGNRRR